MTFGVLGGGASPAVADDDDGLHVHVHGNLQGYGATPCTVRLAVSFDVFGRADSLAGAGWDGGTGTGPAGLVPGGPFRADQSERATTPHPDRSRVGC